MTPFVQGVRTFDAQALETACAELHHLAVEPFRPDLIVGIRHGGFVVARLVMAAGGSPPDLLPLSSQRPSTDLKRRTLGVPRVMARLPRPAADRLRLLEHRWQTRRPGGSPAEALRRTDPVEIEQLRAWCGRAGPAPRILVVDDAVDTGATLAHALAVVRSCAPSGAVIRTAVITVTTRDPVVHPDHALLHGWLCRFPWSMDA